LFPERTFQSLADEIFSFIKVHFDFYL